MRTTYTPRETRSERQTTVSLASSTAYMPVAKTSQPVQKNRLLSKLYTLWIDTVDRGWEEEEGKDTVDRGWEEEEGKEASGGGNQDKSARENKTSKLPSCIADLQCQCLLQPGHRCHQQTRLRQWSFQVYCAVCLGEAAQVCWFPRQQRGGSRSRSVAVLRFASGTMYHHCQRNLRDQHRRQREKY